MHLRHLFVNFIAEFNRFLFKERNTVGLAMAVVIGAHLEKMIQGISEGLITPLVTPFIVGQDWHEFVIPYFGQKIQVGRIIGITVDSILVGLFLFAVVKLMKISRKLAKDVYRKNYKTDDSGGD